MSGRSSAARSVARAGGSRSLGFWGTAWRCAFVIGGAALFLTTCALPTQPFMPPGAVAFTPPAVYHQWWSMVESCAGQQGPFSAVRWYMMPGVQSFARKDMKVAGVWTRANNSIVVGEHVMLNGQLVRHEMLHALMQYGIHTRREFLQRCGGVVTCLQSCIEEAGPAHAGDPEIPRVPATQLEVDFEISPARPAMFEHEGWFSLIVKARNPSTHPVLAILPSAGTLGSRSFALDVAGPAVSYRRTAQATDTSMIYFGPGETKRHVFDFRLTNAYGGSGLAPGTYTVRAGYGDRWTSARTVVLGP